MILRKLAGVACCMLVAILGLAGLVQQFLYRRHWMRVEGLVLRLVPVPIGEGDMWMPEVRYVINGREIQSRATGGQLFSTYTAGQKIFLFVNPDDRSVCALDDAASILSPLIIMFVGAAFAYEAFEIIH